MIQVKNTKWPRYTMLVLWKISLDLVYCLALSKIYPHWHMTYTFSIERIIVAWITLFLFMPNIVRLQNSSKSSDIIVELFSLCYFMPLLTLFSFDSLDAGYYIFAVLYWCAILVLNRCAPRRKPKSSGSSKKEWPLYIVFFGVTMVSLLLIIYYSGFNFSLSLANAYSIRDTMRTYNIPKVLSYIRVWSVTIVPVGVVLFFTKKKYLLAIALSLLQIVQYGFDGFRSTLLYLLAAFVIALLYRRENCKVLAPALSAFSLLGLVEYWVNKPLAQIVRLFHFRTIFTPPLYSSLYYDFFSSHEYDYLRTSIMRRIGLESPYKSYGGFDGYTNYIGYMYNHADENANTGLLGDSFANFGWLSLAMYPLLYIILLRILDYYTEGIDYRVKLMVCIILYLAFVNGSYFQVILTNGFLIICFVCVLIRRQDTMSLKKKYE